MQVEQPEEAEIEEVLDEPEFVQKRNMLLRTSRGLMSVKTTRHDSSSPFLFRTSKRSAPPPAAVTFARMLTVPEDVGDLATKEASTPLRRIFYTLNQ